jgi:hypothetical protein
MGDAYPQRGAPGHAKVWVPLPGRWVKRAGSEIPSARA